MKPVDLPNMNNFESRGGSSSLGGEISFEKARNFPWSRYGASSTGNSFIGMIIIRVVQVRVVETYVIS